MLIFHSNFKILLLLTLLLTVKYNAQDYSFFPETIKVTAEFADKGEFVKALEYNMKALKECQKKKDKVGVANGYINIAFISLLLSKINQSIYYLDKAKVEMEGMNDPLLEARLYSEYAKIDTKLGLLEKSNENFNKAIEFSNKISNEKQKNFLLFYTHIWKRLNFMNQKDSLIVLEKKSLQYMPSGIVYTQIANRFIKSKSHLDSAEYYLNKALAAQDSSILAIKGLAWYGRGNLSYVRKNPEKTLDYYLKSLQYFEKIKFKINKRILYDSISNIYGLLSNKEKSDLYLRKYKLINDTIENEQKEAINVVVQNMVKQNEKEDRQKQNKLYLIIGSIIILCFLTIYFIRKNYLKKQRQKDSLLFEKSTETDLLKRKVNESFDEIIMLAKNGDPFFLIRFKEVYPEFYAKIIQQHSELTEHDIKFCAYLRLNLINKDIARIENVTLRTVQTKKYRLKKKFNLSSDVDLTKWLAKI